jgi:hypothetical protein
MKEPKGGEPSEVPIKIRLEAMGIGAEEEIEFSVPKEAVKDMREKLKPYLINTDDGFIWEFYISSVDDEPPDEKWYIVLVWLRDFRVSLDQVLYVVVSVVSSIAGWNVEPVFLGGDKYRIGDISEGGRVSGFVQVAVLVGKIAIEEGNKWM